MRLIATLFLLVAFLVIGALAHSPSDDGILRARATIAGTSGSGISGEVLFIQTRGGIIPTVRILARIEGLEPNTVHGFHIHENGTCSPDFLAAGGHFDPGPNGNSNPDANHPFHMGDISNLKANRFGVAFYEHETSRITLSAGPLSLFDANGSAMIVHQNEDLGTTGVAGGSGGPRIACGVIELID
jgi:Cu-Zn family superoxide dismutase